jgi:alpha-galactosidase
MANNIVLIGAGSATFGLGTVGDILKSEVLAGSSIVLHDINPQALSKVEAIAQRFIQDQTLPFTLSATTSRAEALQEADFCIISIEVGDRFKLWEQDWKIPLQYGVRQVFGENGGPGGLFHALRIIPPILEICDDIHTICPNAYVINFSNPMSRICLAIKRRYPQLKLMGLCHEVASLVWFLPSILSTPFSNLSLKAGGLNHFSVLLDARYKDSGQDAYPDIRERAPVFFTGLPERDLILEILERFGYLPITSDSHFGEYIQWAHEVVDHKGILDFYTGYKTGSLQQVPESRVEGTHEIEYWRAVPIMEGILTDSGHEELAVDLPNDGLIDNLPRDLVVEVPAVIDKDGVHGVQLGALPKGIAGLLNNQVAVLDLTVEAVLQSSREVALQALLVDPVVDSLRAAEKILETMLQVQARHLGYLQ